LACKETNNLVWKLQKRKNKNTNSSTRKEIEAKIKAERKSVGKNYRNKTIIWWTNMNIPSK
jgi:hypothetical protein